MIEDFLKELNDELKPVATVSCIEREESLKFQVTVLKNSMIMHGCLAFSDYYYSRITELFKKHFNGEPRFNNDGSIFFYFNL